MHACIHTYIHTCMHTCMHACMHTYIQTYSISSPIRHTCSVHVLSKISIGIYHITVQTHICSQSKINEVYQNKKLSIICSSQDFLTKFMRYKYAL